MHHPCLFTLAVKGPHRRRGRQTTWQRHSCDGWHGAIGGRLHAAILRLRLSSGQEAANSITTRRSRPLHQRTDTAAASAAGCSAQRPSRSNTLGWLAGRTAVFSRTPWIAATAGGGRGRASCGPEEEVSGRLLRGNHGHADRWNAAIASAGEPTRQRTQSGLVARSYPDLQRGSSRRESQRSAITTDWGEVAQQAVAVKCSALCCKSFAPWFQNI